MLIKDKYSDDVIIVVDVVVAVVVRSFCAECTHFSFKFESIFFRYWPVFILTND